MDPENYKVQLLANRYGGHPLAISQAATHESGSRVSLLEDLSVFEWSGKYLWGFGLQDDFSYGAATLTRVHIVFTRDDITFAPHKTKRIH